MPKRLPSPDPSRFGLDTFSQILAPRPPIVGEDPASFDGFHRGMMQSLTPTTPYEGVIAENLIAIEWELLQHRRMRDASLRQHIRNSILVAVVAMRKAVHEADMDADFDRHVEQGGDEDEWKEPEEFDVETASHEGDDLAKRAFSRDVDVQRAALEAISELGLDPVELMSQAYHGHNDHAQFHDGKIQELERRRREVKRDFDALVKGRPIDAEVIEA